MTRILAISFILIASTSFFACQQEQVHGKSGLTEDESFNQFYLRFHRDTAYQVDHITFPLEGLPSVMDGNTVSQSNFTWKRSNWVPHNLFNDPEYERAFQFVNDNMVIETFFNPKTSIGMQRRFAKMNGQWFLIYYAALNRMTIGKGEQTPED